MSTVFKPGFPAFLTLALLSSATASHAALIYSDPFTDNVLVGGADNSGISWYDRSANASIAITADATLAGGNALKYTANNTGTFNRGLVAPLASTINLAVGDTLSLSFSFRMAATTIAAGGNTTTPLASAEGFTFGFYSSNGSVTSGDDNTSSDNDLGFRANFPTGPTASNVSITKETNSGAGGLGTGTDGQSVGLSSVSAISINDFAAHTASMTLTRTAGGVDFLVFYDGSQVAAGTSTVPFTTFDELVFSQGGGSSFLLDNVVVEYVPEPSCAMLAAGTLAVLGLRRSRGARQTAS